METVIGRLTSFAASVECITKSLEDNADNDDVVIKKVSSIHEVLHSSWMKSFLEKDAESQENFQLKFFSKQLEEVVVGLWNATVARQCAKNLRERTSALLRQLCFDLLSCPLCSYNERIGCIESRIKPYLYRRIMMATKSGKSWIEASEHKKAEEVLLNAQNDIKKLMEITLSAETPQEEEVISLNKHQVTVLCHLSEAASGLKEYDRSFGYLQTASCLDFLLENGEKELFAREKERICATSYNFGLLAANQHRLDDAINLLRFSFEFGKKTKRADEKLMAQTLRLLAHVYCETEAKENIAKALGAVELANTYSCHPAGLHLRLKILSKDNVVSESDLKAVLAELLHHKELNIDLGLSACRHLNSGGRYEICEWGLKELLSRFAGSRHVGRVHAERLQAAVQRLPINDAVEYTEKFFGENDVIRSLDESTCKSIQLLLWEQAAKYHEAGQMDLSLAWYDQSLHLFLFGRSLDEVKKDAERSSNVAKLHRNRTGCLLNLGRLMEAEDSAKNALAFDENSQFSYFVLFKVSVALGKQEEAIEAVTQLMSRTSQGSNVQEVHGQRLDTRHSLICLAAQHALEKNQRDVAMATLHYLATTGKHEVAKLTAFRCLVRLYLTMCDEVDETSLGEDAEDSHEDGKKDEEPMEEDEAGKQTSKDRSSLMAAAVNSVKDAFQVLKELRGIVGNDSAVKSTTVGDILLLPDNECHVIDKEQFSNEVTWFMKITWNMALQFSNNPTKMKELFQLCKQLLDLLEPDHSVLLRQKTCLFMCAACGLAIGREADSQTSKYEFEDVIETITKCWRTCSQLNRLQNVQSPCNEDKSSVLLALYHFEALAKLSKYTHQGEPQELLDLFCQICELPQADVKTFETVAALSMELPAHHPQICQQAVKIALKCVNRQLTRGINDTEKSELLKKRSGLYRLLINTSLNEACGNDPVSVDKSWIYFHEVYQLMQNNNQTIPELDRLWFSVRCWNVGVRLYIADHPVDAEKWCALALRLLAQLERFKENYENHMNVVYQEILAKKDFRKARMANET